MNSKSLSRSVLPALLLILISLVALIGSTYAWFSFHASTNITWFSGVVSSGEGSLLIALNPSDEFSAYCELGLNDPDAELLPVTTADLEHFYTVRMQDRDGIAVSYAEANERAQAHSLNGTVYLKAEDIGFSVYLWLPSINCGADEQALAAMRLGLRLETLAGTHTYIFRLDELGSTDGVSAQRTVANDNTVVSRISSAGEAEYASDPSKNLSDFAAQGTADNVLPGRNSICTLAADEIARVDYFLYLEGCDENCINSVQGSDIALQLGFAGTQTE